MHSRQTVSLYIFYSKGHCTLSLKFFTRWKINTTSRCVSHVYTLPSETFVHYIYKKKIRSGSVFAFVASILRCVLNIQSHRTSNSRTPKSRMAIVKFIHFFRNGLINTHWTQCVGFLCVMNFLDTKTKKRIRKFQTHCGNDLNFICRLHQYARRWQQVTVFMSESVRHSNRFIQKHWFIQEWNTTALCFSEAHDSSFGNYPLMLATPMLLKAISHNHAVVWMTLMVVN